MEIDKFIQKDEIPADKIEYLQKEQHELRLLGKALKKPGHSLFSYNTSTGEIKKIEGEKQCAYFMGGTKEELKVTVEKHCIYGQALNKRNFIKHLTRYGYTILFDRVRNKSCHSE